MTREIAITALGALGFALLIYMLLIVTP